MNQKLSSIKRQIDTLRETGGPRTHLPEQLWQEISQCCESRTLSEVCQSIGINPARARSKLKLLKNNHSSSMEAPFKLVQLPSSPTPIMELSLGNGTLIRVFSV